MAVSGRGGSVGVMREGAKRWDSTVATGRGLGKGDERWRPRLGAPASRLPSLPAQHSYARSRGKVGR